MESRNTPSFPELLADPEPITFAMMMFTAVVGSTGLLIAMKSDNRQFSQSRAEVRGHMFSIERYLGQSVANFNAILSVFEENNILYRPLILGQNPIYVSEKVREELDRLTKDIFYAGRNLREGLIDLSTVAGFDNSQYVLDWARSLNEVFERARTASTFLEFITEIGEMLRGTIILVYYLGDRYEYRPISSTLIPLEQTLAALRERKGKGQESP